MVCATSKGSDQPAHTHNLIRIEYSLSVKLLTEHHLEFLSIKRGCTGSSECQNATWFELICRSSIEKAKNMAMSHGKTQIKLGIS